VSVTTLSQTVSTIRKQKVLLLFLVPAVVTVLVFNYTPMFGLVMAVQNYKVANGFFGSEFAGFAHFAHFLKDPGFFLALKNTLGINFLSILFGFPAPIILALLLDSIRSRRFKRFTQTITYLPHFISWVIVASLVYRMLDPETGMVNFLINAVGGESIPFMRDPRYFWGILVSTLIWKEIGWNSIIYLAAISGIDPQLYDAAKVDGAGRMRCVRHITLPSIAPTIALMFVLGLGSLVHVSFDAVFNLMNPLVYRSADVIDTYVYRVGIQMTKYSYATAIGLAQSVISVILVVFGFKLAKKFNGYSIV